METLAWYKALTPIAAPRAFQTGFRKTFLIQKIKYIYDFECPCM